MRGAGPDSGAYIVDLDTGTVLYSERATDERPPASVEKLYTTTTALARFGLGGTLETSVLGSGTLGPSGVWQGNLYLKGGGDPTFGSTSFVNSTYGAGNGATVAKLAKALLASTHITSVSGSILGDASFFDAFPGEPSSDYQFDPFLTGTLSGLSFNRGASGSYPSPAAYAAAQLAATLRSDKVAVSGHSAAATAAPGTPLLASLASPPMSTLVDLTNLQSDNFFAETLAKDLGATFGGAGSTAAGAHVVRTWLAGNIGIYPSLVDGSGLSLADRTSPSQIVALLSALWPARAGALAPIGTALLDSLPVAGRTGTLATRMTKSAATGRCEAKTGTLTGYSSLAGWCDGRFAFALLDDGISTNAAHVVQDRIVNALAALA